MESSDFLFYFITWGLDDSLALRLLGSSLNALNSLKLCIEGF